MYDLSRFHKAQNYDYDIDNPTAIMGFPDDMKLKSCMILFREAVLKSAKDTSDTSFFKKY